MAKKRFLERLMDESYEIRDGPFAALHQGATAAHFSDVEARFRKELASFLPGGLGAREAVIVSAGLYALWRERRAARRGAG